MNTQHNLSYPCHGVITRNDQLLMNEKTVRRFWAKVQKTPDCWLWTASKRHKGYGAFCWYNKDGKYVQGGAHRFAYQLLVGPIPTGMFVLHKCDTPACVNPEHLFIGTSQDNVDDMMRKGRHVAGGTYTYGEYKRGMQHWNSKLTPEAVRDIRDSYHGRGISMQKIADTYGVAISCVSKVVNKKLWAHEE